MATMRTEMLDDEQVRAITRVAWLYHVRGLKQSQVADQLGLSQSRVSRLLESAVGLGIVRTTVRVPSGLQFELEQALIEAYGLADAHVFDAPGSDDEATLLGDLGKVLAAYLDEKPLAGDIVGFTSWSRTLRECIRALDTPAHPRTAHVVEMLGDVGPPDVQHEAAEVTRELAKMLGAQPKFLRVPGVVGTARMRRTLLESDTHAREALKLLDRVDEALVGVGTCAIDAPLRAGENFFTQEQFDQARKRGAVGQVNLRFIDADGQPVSTKLDELVIGVSLDQLRACRRTIAVAGGATKVPAIRGAMLGGWVNTVVTDTATAEELVRLAS